MTRQKSGHMSHLKLPNDFQSHQSSLAVSCGADCTVRSNESRKFLLGENEFLGIRSCVKLMKKKDFSSSSLIPTWQYFAP